MRYITLTFIASLNLGLTFGQIKPLILKGQLKNCADKKLVIFFTDEYSTSVRDTITLDDEGKFYFKTFKVKAPQQATISQKSTYLRELLVAPGYELVITGDATDHTTLLNTTIVAGIGSESNQYRNLKYKLWANSGYYKDWFPMTVKECISFAKGRRRWSDSLVNVAFAPYLDHSKNKNYLPPHDPYLAYFKKMLLLNNKFEELNLYLVLPMFKKYGWNEVTELIKANLGTELLADINNEVYLSSYHFKEAATNAYLDYRIKLDQQQNPGLKGQQNYKMIKADQIYKGKTKDMVLFRVMSFDISLIKDFDQLKSIKAMFEPYLRKIQAKELQKRLNDQFKIKEAELLATAVGQPAPAFTLESNTGTKHSLTDHKGKVVFIDLWASWCKPCRIETPYLADLVKKYESDSRLKVISIAVGDRDAQWRQALEQDKPQWLQLIDKDGQVNKAYNSNFIPQFVIVDKKGNIVNFKAPYPSTGSVLENLLITELNKTE